MGEKRLHMVQAKPGQLVGRWGRPSSGEAPDVIWAWGGDGAAKSDANCVGSAFEHYEVMPGKTLRALLDDRGYDIKTLRFSISQKEPN
jgi:hypothetical protein